MRQSAESVLQRNAIFSKLFKVSSTKLDTRTKQLVPVKCRSFKFLTVIKVSRHITCWKAEPALFINNADKINKKKRFTCILQALKIKRFQDIVLLWIANEKCRSKFSTAHLPVLLLVSRFTLPCVVPNVAYLSNIWKIITVENSLVLNLWEKKIESSYM